MVVCTGLTVAFFINFPAVAIFPLAMDVFFIATAVRAFRGDWDAEDPEEPDAT